MTAQEIHVFFSNNSASKTFQPIYDKIYHKYLATSDKTKLVNLLQIANDIIEGSEEFIEEENYRKSTCKESFIDIIFFTKLCCLINHKLQNLNTNLETDIINVLKIKPYYQKISNLIIQ